MDWTNMILFAAAAATLISFAMAAYGVHFAAKLLPDTEKRRKAIIIIWGLFILGAVITIVGSIFQARENGKRNEAEAVDHKRVELAEAKTGETVQQLSTILHDLIKNERARAGESSRSRPISATIDKSTQILVSDALTLANNMSTECPYSEYLMKLLAAVQRREDFEKSHVNFVSMLTRCESEYKPRADSMLLRLSKRLPIGCRNIPSNNLIEKDPVKGSDYPSIAAGLEKTANLILKGNCQTEFAARMLDDKHN